MVIVEPTLALLGMLMSYTTSTLLVLDHWATTLLLLVTCWVVPLGVVELIETSEFESEIPDEVLILSTIAASLTDDPYEPEVVTVTVVPFVGLESEICLSVLLTAAAAEPVNATDMATTEVTMSAASKTARACVR
jgi:hypothetical protein